MGFERITLNRPERRNAMTPEMQEELIAAVEEAAAGLQGGGVLPARARRSVLDWIWLIADDGNERRRRSM